MQKLPARLLNSAVMRSEEKARRDTSNVMGDTNIDLLPSKR